MTCNHIIGKSRRKSLRTMRGRESLFCFWRRHCCDKAVCLNNLLRTLVCFSQQGWHFLDLFARLTDEEVPVEGISFDVSLLSSWIHKQLEFSSAAVFQSFEQNYENEKSTLGTEVRRLPKRDSKSHEMKLTEVEKLSQFKLRNFRAHSELLSAQGMIICLGNQRSALAISRLNAGNVETTM